MKGTTMHNMSAHIETEARDCDGMHYGTATYDMLDEERASSFGDMEFTQRIVSYMVSATTLYGTLKVTQDENGLPILEWDENTEEGYRHERATFTNNDK